MGSLINKLRPFSEWHDMDDRLSRSGQEAIRKREAFITSQGRAFRSFLSIQPESIQPSVSRAQAVLARTQEPSKLADEVIPKVRNGLNQLRPLNEEIKSKRKLTQLIRDKAAKSTKKAGSASAKLEALQARNPASPDVVRLKDNADRAESQKQADNDALHQREAHIVIEEVEYKKKLFMAVLKALDDFVAAKGESATALVPIGEELEEVGGEIPFFEDPQVGQLRAQLEALENEPQDD
jgi:hypothetical protein